MGLMFWCVKPVHCYDTLTCKMIGVFTRPSLRPYFFSDFLSLHRGAHLLSVTLPIQLHVNVIKWNFKIILITYSHCAPSILDFDPNQFGGLIMVKFGLFYFWICAWTFGVPISHSLLHLYHWKELNGTSTETSLHIPIVHLLFLVFFNNSLILVFCLSFFKWNFDRIFNSIHISNVYLLFQILTNIEVKMIMLSNGVERVSVTAHSFVLVCYCI